MKIVYIAFALFLTPVVAVSTKLVTTDSKSFNALASDDLFSLAAEVYQWTRAIAGQTAIQHDYIPHAAAEALSSLSTMSSVDKMPMKLHLNLSSDKARNAMLTPGNATSINPNLLELLKRYHDGKLRIAELAKIQPKAIFTMQTPFALMTPKEFQAHVDRGKPFVSRLSTRVTGIANAAPPLDNSTRGLRQMANPSSIDWDASGKVTAPREQGNCGVCSVFATVAAIESGYAIVTQSAVPSLSEQDYISCGPRQGLCAVAGSRLQDTLDWVVNFNGGSLCTRSSFPYGGKDGSTVTCARYDDPSKACYKPDIGLIGYLENQFDDHTILEGYVAKRPVAVAVNGQSWLQHYCGGVLMGNEALCPSNNANLNHAVTIVGYGTTSDGIKFWKAKNSWGTSWGENGFLRIERGYQGATFGACGIETLGIVPKFRSDQPLADNQRCAPVQVGHQTLGPQIGYYIAQSTSACCDMCRGTPNCAAVNRDDAALSCTLLSAIQGDQVVSGMSTTLIRTKSQSNDFCTPPENNADYGGNDLMRLMTATSVDCCDACMRHPSCTAYTWTQWNSGSCFLKAKRGSTISYHPANSDGSSYYVSGESYKCQQFFHDHDIIGQDLSNVPAANSFTCCGICRTTSGCVAFTWTSYSGGTCWLKTGNANMVPSSGAASASVY